MAAQSQESQRRPFRNKGPVFEAVLWLAGVGYILASGVWVLARAEGAWGHVAAVGAVAVMVPVLGLVVAKVRRARGVAHDGRGVILGPIGVVTLMIARVGADHGWPAWVGAVWLVAAALGYVAARVLVDKLRRT